MIKFSLHIIFIFFTLISITFATSTNNTVYSVEKNTSLNIQKAKLLESHVYNLKKNLLDLKNKYQIKGSYEVDQIQKELSIIISSLKKIQSLKIEKNISEKVTTEALRRLKILTPRLKNILNKHKKIFDSKSSKSQLKYVKIADFLSNKIESIVISVYKPIKNKKNYSLRDSKIILHLKNLLRENNKLKKFKDDKFIDENETKKKLINILRSVQNEISGLKGIIN